jgi:hypothetical protein
MSYDYADYRNHSYYHHHSYHNHRGCNDFLFYSLMSGRHHRNSTPQYIPYPVMTPYPVATPYPMANPYYGGTWRI